MSTGRPTRGPAPAAAAAEAAASWREFRSARRRRPLPKQITASPPSGVVTLPVPSFPHFYFFNLILIIIFCRHAKWGQQACVGRQRARTRTRKGKGGQTDTGPGRLGQRKGKRKRK
jgi:hypothetical protein